jgi:hypothetical protein
MGLPIAAEMTHTKAMVSHARLLFLCFAYFMGWVTAMYLQEYKDRMEPSFRT